MGGWGNRRNLNGRIGKQRQLKWKDGETEAAKWDGWGNRGSLNGRMRKQRQLKWVGMGKQRQLKFGDGETKAD